MALHAASVVVGIVALALLAHAVTHDLVSSGTSASIAAALVVALVAFSCWRLRTLRRRRRETRVAPTGRDRTLEG